MKAWHVGAIIGGLIGLTKVMDSIFYPAIGAIVGGTIFEFVFWLFKGKVKLWKRGGIVGAVWGLVSYVMIWLAGWTVDLHELPLLLKIVFLPMYFLTTLQKLPFGDYYYMYFGNYFYMYPTYSVLIGILIGSIIGYAIEKYNRQSRRQQL